MKNLKSFVTQDAFKWQKNVDLKSLIFHTENLCFLFQFGCTAVNISLNEKEALICDHTNFQKKTQFLE